MTSPIYDFSPGDFVSIVNCPGIYQLVDPGDETRPRDKRVATLGKADGTIVRALPAALRIRTQPFERVRRAVYRLGEFVKVSTTRVNGPRTSCGVIIEVHAESSVPYTVQTLAGQGTHRSTEMDVASAYEAKEFDEALNKQRGTLYGSRSDSRELPAVEDPTSIEELPSVEELAKKADGNTAEVRRIVTSAIREWQGYGPIIIKFPKTISAGLKLSAYFDLEDRYSSQFSVAWLPNDPSAGETFARSSSEPLVQGPTDCIIIRRLEKSTENKRRRTESSEDTD